MVSISPLSTSFDPPPGTQTLARGLTVLRAVANGACNLRAVVDSTGIARSTTHRLLQLLEQEGYIQRKGGEYLLGPALIEYGFLALSQNPVPVVARPVLKDLVAAHKDTAHLAVRDADQVLYLEKVAGSRGAVARSRIGHRMPLTRTGIGKALIFDDEPDAWETLYRRDNNGEKISQEAVDRFIQRMTVSARSGAAMDLEENEHGIRCVAAPVRNGSGRIVAAISISAARPYMPQARMRALGAIMNESAERISRRLGFPSEVS